MYNQNIISFKTCLSLETLWSPKLVANDAMIKIRSRRRRTSPQLTLRRIDILTKRKKNISCAQNYHIHRKRKGLKFSTLKRAMQIWSWQPPMFRLSGNWICKTPPNCLLCILVVYVQKPTDQIWGRSKLIVDSLDQEPAYSRSQSQLSFLGPFLIPCKYPLPRPKIGINEILWTSFLLLPINIKYNSRG